MINPYLTPKGILKYLNSLPCIDGVVQITVKDNNYISNTTFSSESGETIKAVWLKNNPGVVLEIIPGE